MNDDPLPALLVAHTTLGWGVHEVLVALGQTHVKVVPGPGNLPLVQSTAVFLQTLSMSPQTAKLLSLQLSEFVAAYEAKHGVIPTELAPRVVPPTADVVQLRQIDQPAADPMEGLQRAEQVVERTKKDWGHFWGQQLSSLTEDHPGRRHLSDEYPQAEPEPSPSEPTP